ncbi:hypothetical protein HJC23_008286 [Cyclotella cryptica]|uniref:Helicase-associated domain-containing protein n=1 Tax=Cyclotella cryptica TaxID=29204 RepID=A0ABD3PE06_9STRA|eukprot:CCRYP_015921-RB/>CCRYP_015921-RB protein AED:0.30 eAED:0.30 QI:256/1/1/1/0.5/0.33/3/116/375
MMNQSISHTSKKYNNKEWSSMFEKLQAYKREHNTCNVPKRYQSDPKLGHWVHYQRTMCKADKLSQERKELLESIGFVWSERQSSQVSREQTSWDERFQELKRFQTIHGHCKVPRKGKDAALGRWVKWQRWNRTLLDRGESSVLTKRKIKLLNSIGFSWGYQRVPPQKKVITSVTSEPSIEPLPYMAEDLMAPTSSAEPISRNHVVSPPFSAASLKSVVDNSESGAVPTLPSRYGESSGFVNHEVDVSRQFNQVNFVRSRTMSPVEEDSVRFDKQIAPIFKSFDLPTQFQGYVMEPVPENIFHGMNAMNAFQPVMEGLFKMQGSSQVGTRRFVASRGNWKCSVCRYASFNTFEEALAHENNCNGFPEGSICRACAA